MIIISTSIQHLIRLRCYVRWYSELLIRLLFDLEETENQLIKCIVMKDKVACIYAFISSLNNSVVIWARRPWDNLLPRGENPQEVEPLRTHSLVTKVLPKVSMHVGLNFNIKVWIKIQMRYMRNKCDLHLAEGLQRLLVFFGMGCVIKRRPERHFSSTT